MQLSNEQALRNALWNIEPQEEDSNYIGVCENCGSEIYNSYEYLESDDRDKFCDESCFMAHAFENYLHKRS